MKYKEMVEMYLKCFDELPEDFRYALWYYAPDKTSFPQNIFYIEKPPFEDEKVILPGIYHIRKVLLPYLIPFFTYDDLAPYVCVLEKFKFTDEKENEIEAFLVLPESFKDSGVLFHYRSGFIDKKVTIVPEKIYLFRSFLFSRVYEFSKKEIKSLKKQLKKSKYPSTSRVELAPTTLFLERG